MTTQQDGEFKRQSTLASREHERRHHFNHLQAFQEPFCSKIADFTSTLTTEPQTPLSHSIPNTARPYRNPTKIALSKRESDLSHTKSILKIFKNAFPKPRGVKNNPQRYHQLRVSTHHYFKSNSYQQAQIALSERESYYASDSTKTTATQKRQSSRPRERPRNTTPSKAP